MMGGYGWGMGLGWIGMVLFWVFIAALAVWIVLTLARTSSGGDARRILDERFARGEIDADEHRARAAVLGAGR